MKIITRSVFFQLMSAIAEGIVPFTFVFMLKRIFKFTELLVADGASTSTVITMLFSILPSVMMMSFPIAILLGSMMVYGRMAMDRELIALYSCGYSIKQLLTPALVIGLITTALLLWWGHRIAPKGNRIFQATAIDVVQKTATAGIRPGEFTSLGGMVFSPSSVESGNMHDLKLFEQQDKSIAGVITAPTANLVFHPDENILTMNMKDGVLHQTPNPERDIVIQFATFSVSIIIPNIVSKYASPGRDVRYFSNDRLKQELEEHQLAISKARDETIRKWYYKEMMKRELELASRTALPMSCIIMVFLGAILGMRSRSAKRSACYSLTVAAVFLYYTLLSFGSRYAEDGSLPVWLGVWLPNIVSLAVVAALYQTMKDR